MKPVFDRSRTTFEKIVTILVIVYCLTAIFASGINPDVIVYGGFGTYVIIGLISFIRPKIMIDVLKKEDEDYLVRNQRKIPRLKNLFRLGGFTLAVIGAALNYIFVVYY